MKKILFVISYLDKGGSERALSNITTHFPDDYQIDILVNSDKVIDYPYKANIISMGLDEKPKTGSVLFQLKVLMKRLSWLRKLKSSGEYIACISFLDSANVANILACRKKCKTIVSVRNSLKKQSKLPQYKYIVNPLVKALYNKADKIVACSKGIENELISIYKLKQDKVTTIENGYDIDDIKKKAEESIEPDIKEKISGKKLIVTVGRLTYQKGQWHLIRAFNKLLEEYPDSVLMIIGTGELEGYLKSLVKSYNIEDKVIFTGYTDNPFKYEKHADVFVLPSLYEGFPNALAEAVCLGIPCVTADFETGAREILAPELVGSDEVIDKVTVTRRGVLTPVCSGVKYAFGDVLENNEIELFEGVRRVFSKNEIELHNCQESFLDIILCINKWKNVIENK